MSKTKLNWSPGRQRHFRFKWMSKFIWFLFKKEIKGFRVTSSEIEQGWTICYYIGTCPIYVGYYGWWRVEIRLGKLSFCFKSRIKQLKNGLLLKRNK